MISLNSACTLSDQSMAGLDKINKSRQDFPRIPIKKLATLKAEVQFEQKEMARITGCSSHCCCFDSIFCGKIQGIESNTPEPNGRSRTPCAAA